MRTRLALLFPLLLIPNATSPSLPADEAPIAVQSTDHQDPDIERALAGMVSEVRMQETVRRLTAFGPRMGGTSSGDAAAEWLAGMFSQAGLEVEIREDAEVDFHEEDEWEVSVVDGATLTMAWPNGGSPSVEGTGPLSLTPAEGAVWLTSENPSPEDAAGCLAVLHEARPSPSGWPTPGRLRGEWSTPVFRIAPDEATALRAGLEEDPDTRIRVSLIARTGRGRPKTVVATLPGRDRSRYFIFSAHGDSDAGGPGADDNASGVAVVLEIGRVLSDAVQSGLIDRPAYDIRFISWGTEIGSTRQYVQKVSDEEPRLQGVINYDQAGFGSWRDALYFEPDDVPVNSGIITLIRSVASDHLNQEGFPQHFASTRSQGGTDSYVFQSERVVGDDIVPSITVYTSAWNRLNPLPVTLGFEPVNWYEDEEEGMVSVDGDAFYHSAGDTPENTTDKEPWNMGWCARVGLLTARRFIDVG
ncbi:M28 family metallopeptidase [Gemmatimonadota bacterium]